MAWGGRFSHMLGRVCSARGQRVQVMGMGHVPEQTLGLILQKEV